MIIERAWQLAAGGWQLLLVGARMFARRLSVGHWQLAANWRLAIADRQIGVIIAAKKRPSRVDRLLLVASSLVGLLLLLECNNKRTQNNNCNGDGCGARRGQQIRRIICYLGWCVPQTVHAGAGVLPIAYCALCTVQTERALCVAILRVSDCARRTRGRFGPARRAALIQCTVRARTPARPHEQVARRGINFGRPLTANGPRLIRRPSAVRAAWP